MARWNYKVALFSDGVTFFDAKASGVYVQAGEAGGLRMVNRVEVLPWGVLHDLDGTNDAATVLPVIWNDFYFTSNSPYNHPEYSNLLGLVGKHGTLTLEIPTVGSPNQWTASARMLDPEGEWRPPYRSNTPNTLKIRAYWQLKSSPSFVT
jgi:hypothetical protein